MRKSTWALLRPKSQNPPSQALNRSRGLVCLILAATLSIAAPWTTEAQQPPTNFSSAPVTVNATPTLIAVNRFRNAITLNVPTGGVTVYVGSSASVSTATGFPIAAGGALTLSYSGPVYGIVATGSQALNIAETF